MSALYREAGSTRHSSAERVRAAKLSLFDWSEIYGKVFVVRERCENALHKFNFLPAHTLL